MELRSISIYTLCMDGSVGRPTQSTTVTQDWEGGIGRVVTHGCTCITVRYGDVVFPDVEIKMDKQTMAGFPNKTPEEILLASLMCFSAESFWEVAGEKYLQALQ